MKRLAIIAGAAVLCAFRPPGNDPNSPLAQWFQHQYSVAGAWCCNLADAHELDDQDWRMTGLLYEIRVDGTWYPVPKNAVRDPAGGPNPTGHALAWYAPSIDMGNRITSIRIYCFSPGTEY